MGTGSSRYWGWSCAGGPCKHVSSRGLSVTSCLRRSLRVLHGHSQLAFMRTFLELCTWQASVRVRKL